MAVGAASRAGRFSPGALAADCAGQGKPRMGLLRIGLLSDRFPCRVHTIVP